MGDFRSWEWYITPYAALAKNLTLHFTQGSKRANWARYREAWDLLRVVEIQACADPWFEEVREIHAKDGAPSVKGLKSKSKSPLSHKNATRVGHPGF